MIIKKWLNQPYPFIGTWANHLRSAAWGAIFVTVFLTVFQPFGLRIPEGKFWQAVQVFSYFGLITAAALLLLGCIMKAFPQYFNEKKWTVGREILVNVLGVSFIGMANMVLAHYIWNHRWGWDVFFFWQWVTLLVGLGPIFTSIYLKQKRLNRRHAKGAEKLNAQLKPQNPKALTALTLCGDNQGEQLSLSPSDLLYLEAADNYVRIFYEKNGSPESALLRGSLKKMEAQLAGRPRFFRCHRTYLVNLDRVERVSGNAQGYKLHFSGTDALVPVSRSLNGEVSRLFSVRSL